MSIVEKIIKEEVNRLVEDKNFRAKLRKFYKQNKMCEKCLMPRNACRCTENSTSFGPKTMLDREVEKEKFEIREVAIVKDSKEKHVIMKDSFGGISCDCNHYLNENINSPCKHINKYLKEATIYSDNDWKVEKEGGVSFIYDKR